MATHRNVAHNWAHQTGNCRTGSRMFYDGPEIYSHGRHFMAGYLLNSTAAILADDRCSVSTSQHQRIIHSAVAFFPEVIRVCEATVTNVARRPEKAFQYILEDWKYRCDDAIRCANQAKLGTQIQSGFIATFRYYNEKCKNIAHKHSLTYDPWPDNLFKEERKIIEQREANRPMTVTAHQERRQYTREERIERFINGESNAIIHGNPSYLRLKPRKKEVVTSQGVTFPEEDARRAWPIIRRALKHLVDIDTRTTNLSFGPFRVDKLDENGLQVDCHTVQRDELIRFANTLGLEY